VFIYSDASAIFVGSFYLFVPRLPIVKLGCYISQNGLNY